MQVRNQPYRFWSVWFTVMAWWMFGGGCMQIPDSIHGPTSETAQSLQPVLIVFIVLSSILMSLKNVGLYQLVSRITLWFYVMSCPKNIWHKSAYWYIGILSYFWTGFRQKKGDFSCLKQWWDHGKTQIKLLCQQHTLNVTRDITRSIKDLECDIVELEQLDEATGSQGHIGVLKTKKMALANLLDTQVQGALVRSRIQDITQMDAPTGHFFGLERRNGQRKMIHSLLSDLLILNNQVASMLWHRLTCLDPRANGELFLGQIALGATVSTVFT